MLDSAERVGPLIIPKLLVSHEGDMPQWADKYIAQVRSVKKVGGDYKISLDGVDYLVDSDEELVAGDKVEVVGH